MLGYVPRLYEHLAPSDLAIVQSADLLGDRALAPDARRARLSCIARLVERDGGRVAKRHMNELALAHASVWAYVAAPQRGRRGHALRAVSQ